MIDTPATPTTPQPPKPKRWLEDNKIYFEIFAFVGLGVMSLIVTIASCVISYNQLRVSKVSYDPLFVAKIERTKGGVNYTISNLGYSISSCEILPLSYIEVLSRVGKDGVRETHIPITDPQGWLTDNYKTTDKRGDLYTVVEFNHDKDISRIMSEINTNDSSNSIFSLTQKDLIRITCVDYFGQIRKTYMLFDRNLGEAQVQTDVADKIAVSLLSNKPPRINLADATLDSINMRIQLDTP